MLKSRASTLAQWLKKDVYWSFRLVTSLGWRKTSEFPWGIERQRSGQASVHVRTWKLLVACFQAVRTKLSHTSYKQQHRPVSRCVLKAFNVFGKAQNRMANQPDTRIWISFVFEKSPVFFFRIFICFFRSLWRFQLSFAYLAWRGSFLSWNFAQENGARAVNIDPSRACPLCFEHQTIGFNGLRWSTV